MSLIKKDNSEQRLHKNLGELFFIGLEGENLLESEEKFIYENQIGGVILFSRNLNEIDRIIKLCEKLKTLTSEPLWIGVDMEGGRVHRLKEPFTQWPALSCLEKKDHELAYKLGLFMGRELQSVGMNLNFTPCLDLKTNPKNKVIGDRSLGSDPYQVVSRAKSLIKGYTESGIFCVTKHFPGHGNTLVDSHEDLPRESLSLEEIRQRELLCYKEHISQMIMTAHILFEKIDRDQPVTLSSYFLNQILRQELGYKDLIISDDLGMKALSLYSSLEESSEKAFLAGCDVLLFCDGILPAESLKRLKQNLQDEVFFQRAQDSLERVRRVKSSFFKNQKSEFQKDLSQIGRAEHKSLSFLIKS